MSINVNHKFLAWLKHNCCRVHDSVVRKFKLWCPEVTGETGMSLAVAGRKRQTVQTGTYGSVPENGSCDRKRTTAGCWQTVLRDVQLQRERRPQTATTWHAWYRNELIQIWWHHTVQHSVVGMPWVLVKSWPVLAAAVSAVSRGRQKSKYQASCGVEYGLQTSLEIGRKPDKHEVAAIEPRVDERDHERTKAVVGNVAT